MPQPWVQPSGAHDAYDLDDQVTHDPDGDGARTWESTVDGNVWEPGVSGWRQVDDAPGQVSLRQAALDAHLDQATQLEAEARAAVDAVLEGAVGVEMVLVDRTGSGRWLLYVYRDAADTVHLAARRRDGVWSVELVEGGPGGWTALGEVDGLVGLGALLDDGGGR